MRDIVKSTYSDSWSLRELNETRLNVRFCMFGLIRAGDVRTAADQVLMLMSVCCSQLDMETTYYTNRWADLFISMSRCFFFFFD